MAAAQDEKWLAVGEGSTQEPAEGEVVLPKYYTVQLKQMADTLSRIAALPEVYNDAGRWRVLYDANRNKFPVPNNPNLILPGMVLEIPSINGEYREGMYY
jgi:nucleoid-associated protein YgaU